MTTPRRPGDDLLDVVRVLLLLQGSILVATTIEALIFGFAFAGGGGSSFVLSAAAAGAALVSRARVRADRHWSRRLVFVVEWTILVALAIDMALAIAITGALPPAVALLTRFVLPVAIIALLRRSARGGEPVHATSGAVEVA